MDSRTAQAYERTPPRLPLGCLRDRSLYLGQLPGDLREYYLKKMLADSRVPKMICPPTVPDKERSIDFLLWHHRPFIYSFKVLQNGDLLLNCSGNEAICWIPTTGKFRYRATFRGEQWTYDHTTDTLVYINEQGNFGSIPQLSAIQTAEDFLRAQVNYPKGEYLAIWDTLDRGQGQNIQCQVRLQEKLKNQPNYRSVGYYNDFYILLCQDPTTNRLQFEFHRLHGSK